MNLRQPSELSEKVPIPADMSQKDKKRKYCIITPSSYRYLRRGVFLSIINIKFEKEG